MMASLIQSERKNRRLNMDNDPQNTPQPQFNTTEPVPVMPVEPTPTMPPEPVATPSFSPEFAPVQPTPFSQPTGAELPIFPKKSNKKWLIITVILTVLLIVVSVAIFFIIGRNITTVSNKPSNKPSPTPAVVVTEKPKPEPEPEIVSIAKGGKATVSNGDIELNVNSVIRNIPRTESWLQASELMAVNITMKNIIENTRMFYDNALKLVADGVEYRKTSHNDEAYKPYFEGSITGGGITREGNVFFEIPKGATDLKLQYSSEEYDTELEDYKTVIYRIDF